MMIFYNIYKSYRLSAITDKAGAGMAVSSLFQGGQVLHLARLAEFCNRGQTFLWCSQLISTIDYKVFSHLYSTGIAAVKRMVIGILQSNSYPSYILVGEKNKGKFSPKPHQSVF